LLDPGFRPGSTVTAAHGRERLQAVTLRSGGREHRVDCERLPCSFGLVPRTQLAQLLGCALDADGAIVVDAAQQTSVTGIYAAGECTGIGGSERAQLQGRIAGRCATGAAVTPPLARELAHWSRFAAPAGERFVLGGAGTRLADADTLICRCEDVTLQELAGCENWVQAKLHTRCGMGSCQGRICGQAARTLWGWTPTAPRQPSEPARIATLAQEPHDLHTRHTRPAAPLSQ